MTIHTLPSFVLERVQTPTGDMVVSVNNVSLNVAVPDTQLTFSYSILSTSPDDLPEVDLATNAIFNAFNAISDTQLIASGSTLSAFIGQVDWAGNTSQVMVIQIDSGSDTFEVITVLGGAALPPISDVAAWNAFEASVTGVSAIPGGTPLSAGANIPFSSIPGVTSLADNPITGTSGGDTLSGTAGNDLIDPLDNGGAGDVINGSAGDDFIVFTNSQGGSWYHLDYSSLTGPITVTLDGDSALALVDKGAAGTDTLIDVFRAANWNTGDGVSFQGTSSNDVFNINMDEDDNWLGLHGGAGNDTFNITGGEIIRLDYRGGSTGINANLATGVIQDGHGGTDQVNISGPTDVRIELRGTDLNDMIVGSDRNERFILRAGNDTLDAGDGWDVLRYDRSGVDGVTVNMATGTATGMWDGTAFTHSFSNIEEIWGSRTGNDHMTGDGNDNYLRGRGGDDTLIGGGGNDTLRGDEGNDTLVVGTNDLGWSSVRAGTGTNTVDLTGIDNRTGLEITHWNLNAGVTVNVDGAAGTGSVNLGANGFTTILGITGALTSEGGIGIDGTHFNDVFNISLDTTNGSWIRVVGGAGFDTFNITQGAGTVRLSYRWEDGSQGIQANLASGTIIDTYGHTDTIIGTAGEIRATNYADNIIGSGADERFILHLGNDTLDGGAGWDTLRYDRNGVEAVTVNMATGVATGVWDGSAFTHVFSNIEEVRGSRYGNDNLTGDGNDNRLEGRGGNDTLNGGGGNDVLIGGEGDDLMNGGDGDDTWFMGLGSDTFNGGAGVDTVVVDLTNFTLPAGSVVEVNLSAGEAGLLGSMQQRDTLSDVENVTLLGAYAGQLTGNASDNRLQSGDGNDTLSGYDGNDTLVAGAGDDLLMGGGGDDALDGGDGNDTLWGGAGNNQLTGGLGNDILGGGNDAETLLGGAGDDSLWAGGGNDQIIGGDGNDEVWAGLGDDSVQGGVGNDLLGGVDGDDTLDGGAGNDTVYAGDGNDVGRGGDGEDILWGGGGDDLLSGGAETDLVAGADGNDTLYGDGEGLNSAGGDDSVWGGAGDDVAYGGQGNDEVWGGNGNNALYGEDGNDVIGAGSGNDTLDGGAGNDSMYASGGDDVLDGGSGNDDMWGGSGNDTLTSGSGNDTLGGGAGNDVLTDAGGNATLYGGDGDDTMTGGAGDDVHWGGAGADTFVFGSGDGNDVVGGFSIADGDQLRLDDALWTGSHGTLSAAQVVSTFGAVSGGNVVLTFSGGETITLNGLTSLTGLDTGVDIF